MDPLDQAPLFVQFDAQFLLFEDAEVPRVPADIRQLFAEQAGKALKRPILEKVFRRRRPGVDADDSPVAGGIKSAFAEDSIGGSRDPVTGEVEFPKAAKRRLRG